jgi:hypothetical protein
MSPMSMKPADIVRREWWVVALAVVVSLALGAVIASQGGPGYVAKAAVDIDQGALSRSAGLATPDQVERAVGTEAARSSVAALTGTPVSKLAADTEVFIFGSPAKQVVVQYRSQDRNEALKVASAWQAEALKQANLLGSRELERVQALIDETTATLAAMPRLETVTEAAARADVAYQLWSLRTQLTGYNASMKSMRGAYSVSSAASVTRESVVAAETKTLAAAGLLGLVFGVAIAAVREGLMQRRVRG